jgi:glutamate/tyrosine decarboxylase-like PLP-dependent enzyme
MKEKSPYRPVLENTLAHALKYLDGLDKASVSATASYAELQSRLAHPLSENGLAAEKVIDELVKDVEGGLIGSAGGRFFAWVIGGSVPASVAADWLTSTWDQNAAMFATSPAEAVIEEICGIWLKNLLGLPKNASFSLVTGCQMAHATGLAAARNAVLAKLSWDVERKGLIGAPQVRILTSNQRHSSIEKALRLIGFGTDCMIELPADDQGCLTPDVLKKALMENPEMATIVLLQAGDLNTGAYDPFEKLIPLAHRYGAWVHVDGAFGLWAAASPKYRHLLKGVELADSWATDGHKWLNVPYDCGYAFVADPTAHRASMSVHASYLVHDQINRDEIDWNPEFSRRGRGVATYAAIRQLGRKGIANLVERTCRHAHEIVTRIGALPGAQMIAEPKINQGLVRFLDSSPKAKESDHDHRTDEVIQAIQKSGEAFFGGTTWDGKRCMRVSVSGWQTSDDDVERTVAAVKEVLERKTL